MHFNNAYIRNMKLFLYKSYYKGHTSITENYWNCPSSNNFKIWCMWRWQYKAETCIY